MTPSKEVEESVEKWQQGLQARLVNKFVRKVQASSNATAREYGRTPTQIWINQVRQKIGVMFGDPTTVPGGKGQGFATSVEVKLWASSYESGDDERLKIAEKVVVNFKVQKNKTAPPKGQGSYVLRLSGPKGGSVDETKLIISLCEKYGQIEKSGAKWNLGMNSFKTKGALIQHLETDMIERERVRKYLLKRMLDL
jgi:recombination protein RecA